MITVDLAARAAVATRSGRAAFAEGRNTVEALEVGFGRLHASAISIWLWYFPSNFRKLQISTFSNVVTDK